MARRKPIADDGQAKVDDLALFTKLKGWVRDSQTGHKDWYKEAEQAFAFVSGRSIDGSKGQWPDGSWQGMVDTGRQPVEFNRIGPIIDSVCGLEVNNRQEVKYLPRTERDGQVNERLSSLAEWARDEAHAEDEESDMFRNTVICGRGATETRLCFEEEPTGKVIVDCLDPIECGVDTGARKPSFSDRRYSWRIRDMSLAEAKAMFPGLDRVALNATWADTADTEDGGKWNKTDYPDETRAGQGGGAKDGKVRIVQIEWFETENRMMVARPGDDDPSDMAEAAWDAYKPANPDAVGQKVKVRKYCKAFLGRASVLEKCDIEAFQINWATGKYDRNQGYHYGLVRPMRDPQMLSNKTLSQVLHILNTNAKGGLIIETGAFRDVRDAEKDWSDPSKTIIVNEGGLGKIKDRTAPAMPQALVQLQEFSLSSIRDVTGVSVEMLGLADRNQPASLEYQRRQSAMTILAGLFSSLRLYRKHQGRTLLTCLKLLPPGVLIRVLIDPEQAQAEYQQQLMQWQQSPPVQQYMQAAQMAQAQGQPIPPPNGLPEQPEPPTEEFMSKTKRGEKFDPEKFGLGADARFDVIVDEAPISPNQKEATWASLAQFLPQLPPDAIAIALKYSPLPETAAKELGDAIAAAAHGGQQGGVPPEMQQAIQQGQQQIQQLTQENAALKDKAQNDAGKLQVDQQKVSVAQADAETRRIAAMSGAETGHAQTELQQQSLQLDYQRLAHEIVKAQRDSMTLGG